MMVKGIFLLIFGIVSAKSSVSSQKYHAFTLTQLNWYEAVMDCASRDMFLANINSLDEQLAVEQAVRDSGAINELFWISATDLAKEGSFRWMSTGKLVSYSNWLQGQPDNYNNVEHCVHLWNPKGFGKWNDSDCTARLFYICEHKCSPKINDMCDAPKHQSCAPQHQLHPMSNYTLA